jgi:predicted metal-dependent HD superfamily phosphohydrolase
VIEELRARWNRTVGFFGTADVSKSIWGKLTAAYGAPDRHYHTLAHLAHCFATLDALFPDYSMAAGVELALWFHDYWTPREAGAVQRSAEYAEFFTRHLGFEKEMQHTVVRTIQRTAYVSASKDVALPERIVLDCDLAVLGGSPAEFDEYERLIRREYADVAEEAYRWGRIAVLASFLSWPRIYATEVGREHFEAKARENLTRSIRRLVA